MSDIVGELARARGAFEQPTLDLLHKRSAPVIVAIFHTAFGRETTSIPVGRLHEQVDSYLDELRLAGDTSPMSERTGRDLCRQWMREQWLTSRTDDDGSEAYSLTSHAQSALTQVTSLTRAGTTLSEHSVATIIDTVRRFNAEVNPDRRARVDLLESEIRRLTLERDRLVSGEPMRQVTADYMLEGYSNVLNLVAALPSDFARVQEAFSKLRSAVLAQFRAEASHPGQVIDAYLDQADRLMDQTAEGRAFMGAFALLGDDETLLQLREDLDALLQHPLADQILIDADRRELRGVAAVLQAGIEAVLDQRNRVSSTLRDYITTHDANHDRELANVLRDLDSELVAWMERAGPRTQVDLPLLPGKVKVDHLREKTFDPTIEAGPAPLRDVSDAAPSRVDLRELLVQGGPQLGSLTDAIRHALAEPDPHPSLGAVFDALPRNLRRPVEVFGLLHLVANHHTLVAHPTDTETYQTVRTDGSGRALAVPLVATTTPTTTTATATADPDLERA